MQQRFTFKDTVVLTLVSKEGGDMVLLEPTVTGSCVKRDQVPMGIYMTAAIKMGSDGAPQGAMCLSNLGSDLGTYPLMMGLGF